jgi:glucosyl-dolichyl phosphate glucuronosyltransferase
MYLENMISVIVCTYNRAASLGKTLESLSAMSVPPDLKWELIVVDNNSTDNTHEVVGEFAQTSGFNVRYVFEPEQGSSRARNTAIANSTGEIIAFTDDDVTVSPGWLRELIATFTAFDCMGVGGRSLPAWNGLSRPDWLITDGSYHLVSGPILDFDLGDEAKELHVAPWGLNMAFRREAFEKYGLLRPDLGTSGPRRRIAGGDTEFGNRLLSNGEKIVYSPKAVVFHPVVPERITKSYFIEYYFCLGRTDIRQEGWPPEAVLYFGVPRYLFRGLLENGAHWLVAFNRKKRFYFKAQMYCSLGRLIEAVSYRGIGKRYSMTVPDLGRHTNGEPQIDES